MLQLGGSSSPFAVFSLKSHRNCLQFHRRVSKRKAHVASPGEEHATSGGVVPEHGPRWGWRFVQLFVALGLARQLFVNVARSHAHPQCGGQSGIVQQDAHLGEIESL